VKPVRRIACLALGLLGTAPLPALAQKLGGGTDPEISLVRIIAALVLCSGVAVAAALIISKRGLPQGLGAAGWLAKLQRRSRVTVIEARRLSPHADLCIVRCDDREYVLTCAQGEVRVLAEHEVSADPPAPGAA
jgi:hypothetical protein